MLYCPRHIDQFLLSTVFWGILIWKRQGEKAIQSSGVDYTIIRPGMSGGFISEQLCKDVHGTGACHSSG